MNSVVLLLTNSSFHSALLQNPGAYRLTDNNICAGYLPGGKDTCQGDSGGPLFIPGKNAESDVLVGLVSFGEGCARKNVPAGYSNIPKFSEWINSQLTKLENEGIIQARPTPINPGRKGKN